jgi:hypothetical protein
MLMCAAIQTYLGTSFFSSQNQISSREGSSCTLFLGKVSSGFDHSSVGFGMTPLEGILVQNVGYNYHCQDSHTDWYCKRAHMITFNSV